MQIEKLEAMLAKGQDSVLLRFGLGKAYLDLGEPVRAVEHLAECVELDSQYSAAWKLLGKAHASLGNTEAALHSWRRGLAAAAARGDRQTAKELGVFLRRLDKTA